MQFIERSTCDYAEFIGGLQENERNCKDIAEEKLQETTRINEKGVLCMPMKKTLRQLFTEEKVVLAPEVYDCASTITCQDCGYKALVLSGAEVSMSLKGIPDLGLLSCDEMLMVTRNICAISDLPLVVDGENGYGPALTAAYHCKRFADAGAAGVIIVDSPETRIGGVISKEAAVEKIAACADALKGTDCLLIARTDAMDLDEAIDRCVAYREAGADMTLVFCFNFIPPKERLEACKKINAKDPGWKWYPDLGVHDGKSDVTLSEIAAYGFNFVGIHYLLGSAMTAMTDAGMGNIKNQDNVYAMTKYPRPGIGSEEQIERWYRYESRFVKDPELRNRWPYNYYKTQRH